jgi:hypothetical protein
VQTQHLKGVAPSEAVQAEVRRLVEDRGEVAAMAHLGLSRQTIARLAGGMSVQRATMTVVKLRLGISDDR